MGLLIIGGSGMGEVTPSAGVKMGRTNLFRVDDTTAVLVGLDGFASGNVVARVVKVLPDNTLVMGDATTLKAGSISLDTMMTGGMLSATRGAAFWCESGSTIYGVPFTVSGLSITNVGTIISGFSDENPTFQSDPASGYGALTYVSTSGLNQSLWKVYELDGGGELNNVNTGVFDSGGGTTDFAIMHGYEHAVAGATIVPYMESISGGNKHWYASYYEFSSGTLANRQDVTLIGPSTDPDLGDFNMLQKSAPLASALTVVMYKSTSSDTRRVARITDISSSPSITGTANLPAPSRRAHICPLDADTAICFKASGTADDSDIEIYTIDASAATPVFSSQLGSSISQDGSFNDNVGVVKMSDGNVMFCYNESSSSLVCRMATSAGAKT